MKRLFNVGEISEGGSVLCGKTALNEKDEGSAAVFTDEKSKPERKPGTQSHEV